MGIVQILQEENNRLRNEIKVLQEYKEKAHRKLCRVRDEQKTFGKIRVNTELQTIKSRYDGMHLLKHALHNTCPDMMKSIGKDEHGNDIKMRDSEGIQLA
ncbi:hypothetical protein L4X32_19645, partial [Phocaeicola vulgatus]|nr:hypothetical protein [Phocaeicola vulgatus]